jgi:membrane fusion protein, multidrug efflux system
MPYIFIKKTPKMPVNTAQAAILSIALGVLLATSGCSKPAPAPEPVRAVKVIKVAASGMEASAEYSGEVRARVESRLGFRVAGKLIKRQAEVGQRVKVGQVLAQIDPQDYKLAADAARAGVTSAATNRDLAAADFKRFQALKDQNFISGAELERREASLKSAQAQLDQAQVQLKSQGNQAGYATLVADIAGIITAVEAEQGQVVSAGTPVVRIAQDGPRDVVFNVPEDRVRQWTVGTEVTIKRWADTNQTTGETTGRIREIAASADPITRTFPIKVSVNAAQAPAIGSTVVVLPPSSMAGVQAIKLPTSALFQQGQASYVWVLDSASMTVKSTPVQIATADGNQAVIASGVSPGMLVVSAGVHVLSPDQKVTIFNEEINPEAVKTAQAAMNNVAISMPAAAPAASAATGAASVAASSAAK